LHPPNFFLIRAVVSPLGAIENLWEMPAGKDGLGRVSMVHPTGLLNYSHLHAMPTCSRSSKLAVHVAQ